MFPNSDEPQDADLESVLGATPHEFESRILRTRLTRRNEEPDRDRGPALRHVWVAITSGITVILAILVLVGILASASRREIAAAGDVDAGTGGRLSG